MDRIIAAFFQFAFLYPVVMSFFWMAGGLHFYLRRERNGVPHDQPPPLDEYPMASVLVPCHDEGDNVEETIAAVLPQSYPDFEAIAINDGSSDDTAAKLDRLAAQHARLRVIHLDRNLGKANAMRMGALAAHGEYLVCIDGDALLHADAVHWLVRQLLSGPRVGAVTGNPRIRNRSTVLGRLQVGEFSSIIGMIKRAQRVRAHLHRVRGDQRVPP